jgi:hypothetical protein
MHTQIKVQDRGKMVNDAATAGAAEGPQQLLLGLAAAICCKKETENIASLNLVQGAAGVSALLLLNLAGSSSGCSVGCLTSSC